MIKLEFIWIAFSFYLCLFKIYFIFQCLSRPWVHLGTLPSLPVPGTALILLTAQDPTQGPGTVRPCPREVLGFCLCLSWLIPQPTPFPQRFLMSRAGAVCSTPCHALPWLSWHPGPWKHHPSQHHNNIYSLFLNNYNTFFFSSFLITKLRRNLLILLSAVVKDLCLWTGVDQLELLWYDRSSTSFPHSVSFFKAFLFFFF